jgi:archaeosine synthase
MLETEKGDGLARILKWKQNEMQVRTPELLFIQTPRIPVPDSARIVITSDPSITEGAFIYHRGTVFNPQLPFDEVTSSETLVHGQMLAEIPPTLWQPLGIDHFKNVDIGSPRSDNVRVIYESISEDELKKLRSDKDIELIILGSSMELFDRSRKFLEHIISAKKSIGQNRLIYSPSLGEPAHMAALAYLGIDLFDTMPIIHNARQNVFLTSTSRYEIDNGLDYWFCNCNFCSEWRDSENMPEFAHILGHNYEAALHELGLVRNAIANGTLRELVEQRCAAEPRLVNMLRFADNLHYNYIEEFLPSARKGKMIAATTDSLTRPDVKRFQGRIRERYVRPASGKILLLLPCSARKPYSRSQSHRFFSSAISRCKNPSAVHEVILTSPLGIVPRELELAYPAQHYDIPVTGIWYEEEKAVVRNQLKWLIGNFEYDHIIAHLDEDEIFMVDGIENVEHTGGKRATSRESLDVLTQRLNEVTSELSKTSEKEKRLQTVTTMARYHFGSVAGLSLMEGVEVKGRYPFLKIIFKGNQLGMIEAETGLLSLTMAGAERILSAGGYGVEVQEFEVKGDIFAPGVVKADPMIRPNDEVVVFSNSDGEKNLKGVGRAVLNGNQMVEAERGKAVRIRHYRKK